MIKLNLLIPGKVFDHPLVKSHFQICGRTTFRDVYQKRGILICILIYIRSRGEVRQTAKQTPNGP